MPNAIRVQTVYCSTGNPDTVNDTGSFLQSGQLGQSYDTGERAYQYVQLDSAAAGTLPTALAAGQVLYWKNRQTYTVTNDSRFGLLSGTANSFRNNVAGILRNGSATPGAGIFVLQRGRAITVNEAGSATAGMILISDTSTTADQTLGVAINTAPNCITLGVVRTATSGSTCTADIDIPTIP